MDMFFDICTLLLALLDLSVKVEGLGSGLTITLVQGPFGGTMFDAALRVGALTLFALAVLPRETRHVRQQAR